MPVSQVRPVYDKERFGIIYTYKYLYNFSFLKLFETYPDVGDKVLCSPVATLKSCNDDIIKVQQNILEKNEYKPLLEKLSFKYLKRNVQARFFGLPVCPELHRTIFPKNVDLGCFLKVTGNYISTISF